jgi:hypothetical protein
MAAMADEALDSGSIRCSLPRRTPPLRTPSRFGRLSRPAGWLVGALLGAPCAIAAAADGYLTLSTGYMYRGIVLSDRPTARLGLEQALGADWAAGAWAAGVERDWPFGEVDKGVQLGAYLGRDFDCGPRCRGRVAGSRSDHPGSGTPGWSELSFSLRYRERFGGSLALGRHDAPFRTVSRTVELYYEQPLTRLWSAELGLGRSDYRRFHYHYGEIDLRRPLGRWIFELSARYGDTETPDGATQRRGRLLLSLTLGF